MVGKCANARCAALRHGHEGKLFSVEINLANRSGQQQRRTMSLWLCPRCAGEMFPHVEVHDDTVSVRLAAITHELPATRRAPLSRVQ